MGSSKAVFKSPDQYLETTRGALPHAKLVTYLFATDLHETSAQQIHVWACRSIVSVPADPFEIDVSCHQLFEEHLLIAVPDMDSKHSVRSLCTIVGVVTRCDLQSRLQVRYQHHRLNVGWAARPRSRGCTRPNFASLPRLCQS
jgi:hypothetical protein